MGRDSSIEWTHHTFNPWWGCAKVSPACNHCYAEAWSKRMGFSIWGSVSGRRFFGDRHWDEPLRWNSTARSAGIRKRVFCASMADVFEARPDLEVERARLWKVISVTPWLNWLLLTKRPENTAAMAPWQETWPDNVWIGATVESQEWANRRVPVLLETRARVHFLSCEPLLGPLDLTPWLSATRASRVDWVIAGGESGAHARPMRPEWARGLRDQCQAASVPFHFKQWGEWAPQRDDPGGFGGLLVRLGKKTAGRQLDGRTWDELPTPVGA